jgi:hypothetical protein
MDAFGYIYRDAQGRSEFAAVADLQHAGFGPKNITYSFHIHAP